MFEPGRVYAVFSRTGRARDPGSAHSAAHCCGGASRAFLSVARLTSERTYPAWWRTGLSAFGLCIAIGGVLPAITDGSDWLLVALGAAFGYSECS